MRRIAICLAFLFSAVAALAQERIITGEMIGSDAGVAGDLVNAVFQDRRGFMWFGTALGLARYDGAQFKVYRRANTMPFPLSNDNVLEIVQGAADDLWLGTSGGLNRFDMRRETFTAFRHDAGDPESLTGSIVNSLCPWSSKPGLLWVATADNGLGLFNLKSGKCRSFRRDPSRAGALADNHVRMVLEDSRQRVWVATAGGFQRFLPETGGFQSFPSVPGDGNTIGSDNAWEIFESRRRPGVLWVGTVGGFLNRFDPERGSWQRFPLPAADPSDKAGNMVYWISDMPDDPDRLLVGTRRGLYDFHMDGHTWQRVILQDPLRQEVSLREEGIMAIHCDRSGAGWISILGRGLFKFRPQSLAFRSHRVAGGDSVSRNRIQSLAEDPQGRLWVGTGGAGVFVQAPGSDAFAPVALAPSRPGGTGFRSVTALCPTAAGVLWAAAEGGLVRFDPLGGSREFFPAYEEDPATRGYNSIRVIHEDSRGDVWIGSNVFGLLRRDARSRAYRRYRHDDGDAGSLSSSQVTSILEDRDGVLWIGTWNGLNRYDRARDRFTRHLLVRSDIAPHPRNGIQCLLQDRRGRIWIGTTDGLSRMERNGDEIGFSHFRAPGTTLRNFILGIVEDEQDNLWIASFGGLSRFDMEEHTFSEYDARDGVPSVGFIYGCCLRRQNGRILVGGLRGFFSFLPSQAAFNRFVPPLAFTDIQLGRRPLAIGGGSPLPRSITFAPDLDLAHDQNNLTVSFAALSFIRPERNQYAFRLENRDESWQDLGFEHRVQLDNLRPGRYRLRVRGANNEGIWNEEGISLALRIRPPFWQTWWFRTLAVLAAAALLLQWRRTRSRRLAARVRSEKAMDDYFDKFAVSAREREIIRLLLRGKSNKEIEEALFIAMGTVKNHVYNIYQKLGVKNRAQLIALFKNLQVK